MVDCWSCGASPSFPIKLACDACGKLQPLPSSMTLFGALGLEPRMRLETKVLDQAFRDVSRHVHPDRFPQGSLVERRLALEHTTRVNEAYRTLKDPLRRGEYLMKLEGVDLTSETQRTKNMALLAEMMELQEEVSEAKKEALEPLAKRLKTRELKVLERVARWFDDREGTRDECVDALSELKYLRRLRERIELTLEGN